MTTPIALSMYISGSQVDYLLSAGFLMTITVNRLEFYKEGLEISITENVITFRKDEAVIKQTYGILPVDDIEWKLLLHLLGIVKMGDPDKEIKDQLEGLPTY